MTLPVDTLDSFDLDAAGERMVELIKRLYPLCRSITGDGVRQTLRGLQADLPLEISEVPTGTPVFDWTVPREWNIRDAWIKGADGAKVVDFTQSNLHVVNYSIPVRRQMSLAELQGNLHSLEGLPQAIPYKTSYYHEAWGFCLTHDQRESLADETYEVCIDSSLEEGALTYGECLVQGRRDDEFLFSAHVCHPSLANDNLSAVVVLHELARALRDMKLEYSYRFVFAPGTIGALTWLAQNEARLGLVRGGLVVAGVGDKGPLTYKQSRQAGAEVDLLIERQLRDMNVAFGVLPFTPDGYDERQYGSPGIDLAVGRLSRTPYGTYPEYHTSLDNLSFVQRESLEETLEALLRLVVAFDSSPRYRNPLGRGEPQLGRRGLYSAWGGHRDSNIKERAMLWLLNYSDGKHCLADIAERSGFDEELLAEVAQTLVQHDLLLDV